DADPMRSAVADVVARAPEDIRAQVDEYAKAKVPAYAESVNKPKPKPKKKVQSGDALRDKAKSRGDSVSPRTGETLVRAKGKARSIEDSLTPRTAESTPVAKAADNADDVLEQQSSSVANRRITI